MAELKLTNYTPASSTEDNDPRLIALTHILAFREAAATLSAELDTPEINGEVWLDLSTTPDDLEIEQITESLEYLGMRGLLELNRSHPSLFRIRA